MRNPSIVERQVWRIGTTSKRGDADAVLVEEPLEIRVHGDTVALTMRTPGHDRELAVGFLFAEGVIAGAADVGAVRHCGRPGDEGYGNTIEVTPASGVAFDPERLQLSRRGTLTTAACGVCGRLSIEDMVKAAGRLPAGGVAVSSQVLLQAPEVIRSAQQAFAVTGSAHAAALLDSQGTLLVAHEDVGRHNAVDKVVGSRVLRDQLRRAGTVAEVAVLVVSGRASFEIIQKAAMARIPIVASVSAPSSLAIDLAIETGITLAGFVRGGGFNLYSHPDRIRA